MSRFGALLRRYRRNCQDIKRGGHLTLDRFAEELALFDDTLAYTGATIGNWETGARHLPHRNRQLQLGLISVIQQHGGFIRPEEADTLLMAGNFIALQPNEKRLVSLPPAQSRTTNTNLSGKQHGPTHSGSGDIHIGTYIVNPPIQTQSTNHDARATKESAKIQPSNPRTNPDMYLPVSGAIPIDDQLYINRHYDTELKKCAVHGGQLVTIYAPRQTGKTSLLIRGLDAAKQHDGTSVLADMRLASNRWVRHSFNDSLRSFALLIAYHLDLDTLVTISVWDRDTNSSPQVKLTRMFEKHILPHVNNYLVLGLDEVDVLLKVGFHTDFFSMLRAWNNLAASKKIWKKLTIIMCISTEPNLLIEDPFLSPFNTGVRLNLQDFSFSDVDTLNSLYGSPVSTVNLNEFYDLLGGHPYLVRHALYTIATKPMKWQVFKRQLTTRNSIFESHLQRHLQLITSDKALTRTMKKIVRKKAVNENISLMRLRKAGIIYADDNGHYACRCQLYQQYFQNRL